MRLAVSSCLTGPGHMALCARSQALPANGFAFLVPRGAAHPGLFSILYYLCHVYVKLEIIHALHYFWGMLFPYSQGIHSNFHSFHIKLACNGNISHFS